MTAHTHRRENFLKNIRHLGPKALRERTTRHAEDLQYIMQELRDNRGYSYQRIANYLTAHNHMNSLGRPWSSEGVRWTMRRLNGDVAA